MKNIKKSDFEKAKKICIQHGYWSDQFYQFINQWSDYNKRLSIHNYVNDYR